MSIVDDVRRALEPMKVVRLVEPGYFGATNGVPNPRERPLVSVAIDDDQPEKHGPEAEKLVREAGIDADLNVKRYPKGE